MKTITLKLVSFVIAFSFLTSCSNDDSDFTLEDSKMEAIDVSKISYSQLESDILDLVNAHREEKGLTKLQKLDIISGVAQNHTDYMIENGTVSHDNFTQRVQQLKENANAQKVGENVAYGYGTASGVVNGWLNSDGHREIIESEEYTHFGIATDANNENRNYFTQIFIKK